MAGHLPISTSEDQKATNKVLEILGQLGLSVLKNLTLFQRIKCCGVAMQRLSSDYAMEDNTGEIFCINNWDFKVGTEDELLGAIIEVHLTPEGKLKQLYLVA